MRYGRDDVLGKRPANVASGVLLPRTRHGADIADLAATTPAVVPSHAAARVEEGRRHGGAELHHSSDSLVARNVGLHGRVAVDAVDVGETEARAFELDQDFTGAGLGDIDVVPDLQSRAVFGLFEPGGCLCGFGRWKIHVGGCVQNLFANAHVARTAQQLLM